MTPSGNIFFQDAFFVIYSVVWNTVNGIIDFTTTIQTPFIVGQPPSGYVKDKILFRRGVVNVSRQALRPIDGGYEVIAEGESSYEDDIQLNFPCAIGPSDRFKYHLDRPIIDTVEFVVTDGPRWADPDDVTDAAVIWGSIDGSGNPIVISEIPLEFVDIWS